jgi:hypothetical protein
LSANLFLSNYFAGAGAGAASGAGAGAGTGASTLGASAGASSFFLQPMTARDKEATNSIATKMANIFFINSKPPFKDLIKVVFIITSP